MKNLKTIEAKVKAILQKNEDFWILFYKEEKNLDKDIFQSEFHNVFVFWG